MKLQAICLLISGTVLQVCFGSVPDCCSQGYKHGSKVLTEVITCSEDDIDYSTIEKADSMVCGILFKSCCNTAAARDLCTEGVSLAMSGLPCEERSGPGGKNQKLCCSCCNQGFKHALKNGDCTQKPGGDFCSESFTVCCKNAGVGGNKSVTDPKTSVAPGAIKTKPTTIPTTVAKTKPRTKATRPRVKTTRAPTCFDLRCTQSCQIINGRPMCLCRIGFRLASDKQTCVDINECEEDSNKCGEGGRCFNQQGSYYCICQSGYTRNAFTTKCEDLDECARHQHSCSYKCINTDGSYSCECPRGYTLLGKSCMDVNECASANTQCPKGFSCHNTFGSFACIKSACPSNYYIQRSKFECKLYCPGSDECRHILEQSIKWIAYSFRKTVDSQNFAFTYFVRVNSYLSTTLSFYFASGNDEGNFYVQRLTRESAKIINVRKLIGPKEYILRLHADLLYNGRVSTRFVYFFYLYVSQYDI